MSKQILIYDNIQPLSEKHLTWSVNVQDYAFISHVSSVPILAAEIPFVAAELPVVFSALGKEGDYVPIAIMGFTQGQNLVLDEQNHLITRYVPGFIRRYPFVLGGNGNSDSMAICIDEGSNACDPTGSRGFMLFDDKKEQTDKLKQVGEFLVDYHHRADTTQAFCRHLHDLGLFEPMEVTVTLKNKASIKLNGFYVVNRDKLKALSDADALALFKKDGLELIYAHIQSLGNIDRLADLMSAKAES